jgi:transposase
MTSIILGIDISKKAFDVALLIDKKIKNKKFDNAPKGFNELIK